MAWNTSAVAKSGLTDNEVAALAYLDDALFISKDIAKREPSFWLLPRLREIREHSQIEALRHAEFAWKH